MSDTIKQPRSIGVIVDGNRRWAKERNLPSLLGHQAGYEKLVQFTDWVAEAGFSCMYMYLFSTENWNRTTDEVNYLMDLNRKYLTDVPEKFVEKGYRFRAAGQRWRLADDIQKLITIAEEKTAHCTKMTVVMCVSYGGRAEIVEAVNALVKDNARPKGEVTEAMLTSYMWTHNLPDPDIIFRTSGEHRLSGFLTWGSVYSEFFFPKVQFPGLTKQDFQAMLDEYAQRQRRFGK